MMSRKGADSVINNKYLRTLKQQDYIAQIFKFLLVASVTPDSDVDVARLAIFSSVVLRRWRLEIKRVQVLMQAG